MPFRVGATIVSVPLDLLDETVAVAPKIDRPSQLSVTELEYCDQTKGTP